MTGLGGAGGLWVKKSVVQPPTSSAVAATSPAGTANTARRPGIWRRTRVSPLSRGMGLGPALGAVARHPAARQVDRHPNAEVRPGVLAIDDLHRAAVCGNELQHDGQSDAGALDRGALGRAPGIERFEHVVPVLFGDTRAVVGDVDDN